MKSFLLSAATLAAVAANAAATITIVSPWASSTWVSGGHGNITWTSDAADAKLDCEIQLMNGAAGNSNMVAYVTTPGSPIKCSANAYDIYPLNDFTAGDYWVRIGQSSSNTWAYSGVFKFQGNGTAKPLQLASSGAASIGAATSAPAAASGSGKSSSGTSTSSAAQPSQSESAAGHVGAQGKTLAAVAGGAVVAAMALVF